MFYDLSPMGDIKVSHKGAELTFISKPLYAKNQFHKKEVQKKEDMFSSINQYLYTLPPASVDRLFDILVGIAPTGILPLKTDEITRNVEEFYNLMQVEESLVKWVNDMVPIPDTIINQPVPNKNHSLDKTYNRQDYRDLMLAAVSLKMLIPFVVSLNTSLITGTKRKSTKKPVLRYKNHYRYITIIKSLPTRLFTLPWKKKLEKYVESYLCGLVDKQLDIVVINDMDNDTYTYSVFARTLLVKVMGVPTLTCNGGSHLITHIHTYLQAATPQRGKTTPKKDNDNDVDDGESMYEGYRSKDTLSIAARVEIEHMLSDKYINSMLERYVHKSKFTRFHRICTSLRTKNFEISIEMVVICNWVLRDLVDPKVFDINHTRLLYPLIALTFSLLEDNHPYIATYMLTNHLKDDFGNYVVPARAVNGKKISAEHTEQLCKVFPLTIGKQSKEAMVTDMVKLLNDVTETVRYLVVPISSLRATCKCHIEDDKTLKGLRTRRSAVAELILDLDNILIDHNPLEMF